VEWRGWLSCCERERMDGEEKNMGTQLVQDRKAVKVKVVVEWRWSGERI
jgi:hypothetical protein